MKEIDDKVKEAIDKALMDAYDEAKERFENGKTPAERAKGKIRNSPTSPAKRKSA